jgi:uncharacterized membrane protein
MFPKFRTWIENLEEENPSLSEPQHKTGEKNLSVNKLVEKRIKEMVQELSIKGKAEENDIYNAIKQFLDKNSNQTSNNAPGDQTQPEDPTGGMPGGGMPGGGMPGGGMPGGGMPGGGMPGGGMPGGGMPGPPMS